MQEGSPYFAPTSTLNPSGAGDGGSGIVIVRYPT